MHRHLVTGILVALLPVGAQSEAPYPVGRAFPLMLYSVNPDEIAEVKQQGWNLVHTYHFTPDYLAAAATAGALSLAYLARPEGDDEAAAKAQIRALAEHDSVGWWDLPEELRYWRADEWAVARNYPAWTREIDPRQRPNFMYIANHYKADAIAKYVPHLDIIGAGMYADSVGMPRPWVPWRVEQELEAIRLAGAEVGPDYRAGQKTPVAVLGLFYVPDRHVLVTTPAAAKHDVWASIAAGAKGILIYSYWHRRDTPLLVETMAAYHEAAAWLTAPEDPLGQVVLWGQPLPGLTATVTAGPPLSAPFLPTGYEEEFRFPSLRVAGWTWQGNHYLIAVNSIERPITGVITGLPTTATAARALHETVKPEGAESAGPREVTIEGGQLTDSFGPLGVHLYKLPAEAD